MDDEISISILRCERGVLMSNESFGALIDVATHAGVLVRELENPELQEMFHRLMDAKRIPAPQAPVTMQFTFDPGRKTLPPRGH
jgi:hypothetical protein